MISLLNVLFGAAMLLLGRRLFWLFVAAIGFITVTHYALQRLGGMPDSTILIVAIIAGLLGALIAAFARVVGVGVAGFLCGGFLMLTAATALGFSGRNLDIFFYIVGGILGAFLFYALFNWALIILSSVCGAFVLAHNLPAPAAWFWLLVIGLAVLGMIVQGNQLDEK